MTVDYDVVVIGSGFGGSVSALRLTERGYSVAVLEAGRRYNDEDFAKSAWDLRKFLWAPALGCYGVQRAHVLKDVVVLAGAGVGGGSLNYANTLYKPGPSFFQDSQWAGITDWDDELSPYYEQGERMLGVMQNPTMTPADKLYKQAAENMGVGETFRLTPVGVFFDKAGEKTADPFFGGVGPERTGCTECGQCMVGCRVGAKNTLLKNYLYLAEKGGAKVYSMTTVTDVSENRDGMWTITTKATDSRLPFSTKTFTAENVIFSAGTYGTQKLLHKLRDRGSLPKLPQSLGRLTRTNSESLLGAMYKKYDGNPDHDMSRGVAITSSFYPTPTTHVEPVSYGPGRNPMGFVVMLLSEGDTIKERIKYVAKKVAKTPKVLPLLVKQSRWGERTVIMLVMQNLDNSLTTFTKRGLFGRRHMTTRQGHGEPNPTLIPEGHAATREVTKVMGGDDVAIAGSTWSEVLNIPMTAHFLGGCAIGESPEKGVIDPYHRIYNYPSLFVVDGSSVSANCGVNPSLSITALAERAASMWPNKGEPDRRPPQFEEYVRITPTKPLRPIVPEGAPAALQLPIVEVSHGQSAQGPVEVPATASRG